MELTTRKSATARAARGPDGRPGRSGAMSAEPDPGQSSKPSASAAPSRDGAAASRPSPGVDLRVAAGDIFGFLGPNGAGKTTTLRILATLLPPTAGTARVAGFDVARRAGEVRSGSATSPSRAARIARPPVARNWSSRAAYSA